MLATGEDIRLKFGLELQQNLTFNQEANSPTLHRDYLFGV